MLCDCGIEVVWKDVEFGYRLGRGIVLVGGVLDGRYVVYVECCVVWFGDFYVVCLIYECVKICEVVDEFGRCVFFWDMGWFGCIGFVE